MRIIIIGIVLISCTFFAKAQSVDNWEQYLQDSVYKTDDNNYVYLYKTKGGEKLKVIRFYLRNATYFISTIYGDSAVKTNPVISPNLFQMVYDNYKNLVSLPTYIHNKQLNSFDFKKKFYDSTVSFSQLGIKYHGLHYNHFQKFTEEQISKAGKKNSQGMKVINELYALLETYEVKQEQQIKKL